MLLFTILFLWGVVLYNRLVRDHKRVLAAWSDIDVQLKRRHDLLPKLVEAVKQYTAYEQATMTAVTELRAQAIKASSMKERCHCETALSEGVLQLIAISESYPELKANYNFIDLQENITSVEKYIQYARRYYNGCVRNFNERIDSFPSILVAKLFRFTAAEFFIYEK